MVTDKDCWQKYGNPNLSTTQNKTMVLWHVPQNILDAFAKVRFTALGTIGFPKKIFVNKDFQPVLEKALHNLIDRGFAKEMKSWDGCFIIRYQRGSKTKLSLHSWAIAIDVNREENQMGQTPKLSKGFVECFTDAGCEWGGNWKNKDGMHFQIKEI